MFSAFFKKYHLAFWLLIATFSFVYKYHKILHEPSGGIHQWRQSDCLAITENYYRDNAPFFQPSINWIGASGSDKTVSDFPLIYYITGNLWKIFGQKEIIFRVINLLIFFAGLFALYKLSLQFLRNRFWVIFIPLFIFTSPVVVYYANNFLMNVPALGLSFCAWYFFFRFRDTQHYKFIFVAVLFFTLATLLKATAAISFFTALAIFIAEQFFNREASPFRWKKTLRVSAVFFAGMTICLAWILYAAHYNALHNEGVFLVGTLPAWELNHEEILQTFKALSGAYMAKQFYFLPVLILLALMLGFNLYAAKRNTVLLLITIFLFAGFIAFFLFFFGAFKDKHDYYFIDQYVLVAFILLGFFHTMQARYPRIFSSVSIKALFVFLLFFNLVYCKAKNNIKYFDTRDGIAEKLFLEKDEVEFIEWLKWDFRSKKLTLREAVPYIRALGIKRTDKVLSIPDGSFSITLYLLEQKGFTDFGCDDLDNGQKRIGEKINQGADYLVIHDPDLEKAESLKPYLIHKMGSYKNVSIYDLRPFRAIETR